MTMPAKSAKSADTSKPIRPSGRKRTTSRRSSAGTRRPDHQEIAKRAYFIHLEEGGSDELTNWLRAERELMPA
jgi:hypothetical protein